MSEEEGSVQEFLYELKEEREDITDVGLGGPGKPHTIHHWHLQMLTYSLLRLGPESSASERLVSKASSLRAQLEHGLKEAI